jgi:hypothetical protein
MKQHIPHTARPSTALDNIVANNMRLAHEHGLKAAEARRKQQEARNERMSLRKFSWEK